MAKYLDPKIDVLFKKIFGENKELVISFLNSLLPLNKNQEIVTLEYLSPEKVPNTPLGKLSIVDVRCIDQEGRAFIVEMQSEWSNIFRKRLLLNGSKAIIKQMDKKSMDEKAKKFNELKPVYVLAIVNATFSQGKDWYHHLQIMDFKNPDVVLEGLDFVLVELPNFTPDTWTHAHKKIAVLWLRFLKEIDGYDVKLPKALTSNKFIRSAIKLCEEAAFTPEEREAYERAKEQAQWEDSIKGLEDEVVESRKALADNKKTLKEKDKALEEKDKALEKERQTLEKERQALEKKDKALEEKDKALEEKDKALEEKDKALEEKDKALEEERKALEEKGKALEKERKALEKERKTRVQLEAELAELKQQ
jgi:predicted transposase/invertase (TIGR01784 family)